MLPVFIDNYILLLKRNTTEKVRKISNKTLNKSKLITKIIEAGVFKTIKLTAPKLEVHKQNIPITPLVYFIATPTDKIVRFLRIIKKQIIFENNFSFSNNLDLIGKNQNKAWIHFSIFCYSQPLH